MSSPSVHPVLGPHLQLEVEQFLYHEAALLDERRFEAWLELLTPDVEYRLPVAPPENERGERAAEGTPQLHFEDDLVGLSIRVAHLCSKAAWCEQPVAPTRRMVSNVRIVSVHGDDSLEVCSNLLVYRSRHASTTDLLVGSRRDVLRRAEGGLKIARRLVTLDQRTLMTSLNLVL